LNNIKLSEFDYVYPTDTTEPCPCHPGKIALMGMNSLDPNRRV